VVNDSKDHLIFKERLQLYKAGRFPDEAEKSKPYESREPEHLGIKSDILDVPLKKATMSII